MRKSEQSLGNLWKNIKRPNNCVIRIPEEEEKELYVEKNIWKNNGWKFPRLVKYMNLKIPEDEWIPSKVNSNKSITRHSISKLLKMKTKEKQSQNQPEKNNALFIRERLFRWLWISPSETMEAGRKWHAISQVLEKQE